MRSRVDRGSHRTKPFDFETEPENGLAEFVSVEVVEEIPVALGSGYVDLRVPRVEQADDRWIVSIRVP